MGFRTDTGNFNRLLTSLGIGVLLAALAIPYFFFRDTEVLLIRREQLAQLTDSGRQAIESRQSTLLDLEIWVWVLAGVLFLVGLALLLVGGFRLRVIQDKEDEQLELSTRREGAELKQMDPEELDRKRDKEAKEVAEEERNAFAEEGREEEEEGREGAAPSTPPHPSPQPKPTASAQRDAPPPTDSPRIQPNEHNFQSTRKALVRIENAVADAFQANHLDPYEYFPEIKVVGDGQQREIRLDGLFRSRDDSKPDVVVELKLAPANPRAFSMRIREFADRLIAKSVRYEAITGRNATGWVLVVIPVDLSDAREDAPRAQQLLRRELHGIGHANLIREDEIPILPEAFRRQFT